MSESYCNKHREALSAVYSQTPETKQFLYYFFNFSFQLKLLTNNTQQNWEANSQQSRQQFVLLQGFWSLTFFL